MAICWFVFSALLCWYICNGQHQVCTSSDTVGSGDIAAASVNSPDSADVNVTILVANDLGTIQCCGLVSGWRMYVEGKAFVSLHVWRPVPGYTNTYTLLGNNGMRNRINGISELNRDVPTRNQIHVAPGDVIAVFQEGPALVRYTTCDPASPTDPTICAEDQLVISTSSEPAPGDQVSFTTRQSTYQGTSTVRGYAVEAQLGTKEPVTCTSGSVTISDTFGVGDHVTLVSASNIDTTHPDSIYSIDSITQPLSVTIHPLTGEITTTGPLEPDFPSSDYVVTVRATDVCGGSGVCNITITVTNEPKSINFISLPEIKQLDAWTTGEILSFQISSQRDVDNVTCSVTSTLPEVTSFRITTISITAYTVGITDIAALEDTGSVVVFIECQNLAGYVNESTLLVTVSQDSESSNTNGVNGAFVTVLALLGVIVLFAVVTVILVCLSKKGKIRVWPADDKPTTRCIAVIGDNVTQAKPTQHRIELKRQKTWHQHSKSGNSQVWNTFDKLYMKETSTITLYKATKAHGYHTTNGLANYASRVVMTSHPVENERDVCHPADENKTIKKPWIP